MGFEQTLFKKASNFLAKDRDVQCGNILPIFIQPCAYSGFRLQKLLGLNYSAFFFRYSNNLGEMHYLKSDYRALWVGIKKKIRDDSDFLQKAQRDYMVRLKSFRAIQKKVLACDPEKISDQQLLAYLKKLLEAQVEMVGLGHLLEPISAGIEAELKEKLFKLIKDPKNFGRFFSALTSPSKLSFLAREEHDLIKIKNLPVTQIKLALERHFEKYFWIQNGYGGSVDLGMSYFEERLKTDLSNKTDHSQTREKRKLIGQLKLNSAIVKYLEISDFAVAWQDDRKANVLRNISLLDRLIAEIARRLNLKKEILYLLGYNEVKSLPELPKLAAIYPELKERTVGVAFYMDSKGDTPITGKSFELLQEKIEQSDKELVLSDLKGMTAKPGTVVGRVSVCKDHNSIGKMKQGDILVTSMTRPEFLPAIKRASAIITDEGGITCHAAIVSRELGIPTVIGTKIATKVLKDGMLVEVRANHGVVKIIE